MPQLTIEHAKSITDVVMKVIENNYPADRTLNLHFKNNRITDEYDRGMIAELSYEVIRWWRLLLELHNSFPVTREVDYYKILGTYLVLNNWDIPKNPLFRQVDAKFIKQQFENLSSIRKIRYSVPDWMDQAGFFAYGSQWEKELEALNQIPPIFLRTNRLKIKPAELCQKLNAEGFEASLVDKAPDALKLSNRGNIFSSQYYKDGYFEVQDAGSQQIAMYLDAKPGMRVVDACAGNGGKTLHIACFMQNKGKIIAMDTQEDKIKNLRGRLAKAGVDIVETRVIENSKAVKRIADSVDRLLLDVPCSGTGAIRRNPEIKWNMNTDRLSRLNKIQSDLLSRYSQMVKQGGIMVYATCSILPSENHEQIQKFLEHKKGEFELLKEQTILPSQTGFDGFYMAQLKKM